MRKNRVNSIWIGQVCRIAAIGLVAGTGSCGGNSNVAPSAEPLAFEIAEDTDFLGILKATDPEGRPVTFAIIRPPSRGQVRLDSQTGSFSYAPDADANGADSFAFTASDGKLSSWATEVAISIIPVNDAPRIATIPDLENSPDTQFVRVPLSYEEPDGDPVLVHVSSAEPAIASVRYDEALKEIQIEHHTVGTAQIVAEVSDGALASQREFAFKVARKVRYVHLDAVDPVNTAVVIHNTLPNAVSFGLGWNGRTIYESIDDLAQAALPPAGSRTDAETRAISLWQFVVDHRYHAYPLTEDRWQHDPLTLLNSVGFGLCDDAASALAFIAKHVGFEARVWFLNGHIVPELLISDSWAVLDPDLGSYYRDAAGRLAGVEEIASNPSLLTHSNPLIAEIYTSTDDNRIEPWYDEGAEPLNGTVTLPPGAKLELPGLWIDDLMDTYGNPSEGFATARITLPAAFTGSLPMPLVLAAVNGSGRVRLLDQEYEIGSPDLLNRLRSFHERIPSIEILRANTDVQLVLLINPIGAQLVEQNELRLTGLETWSLDASTRKISTSRSLARFPVTAPP